MIWKITINDMRTKECETVFEGHIDEELKKIKVPVIITKLVSAQGFNTKVIASCKNFGRISVLTGLEPQKVMEIFGFRNNANLEKNALWAIRDTTTDTLSDISHFRKTFHSHYHFEQDNLIDKLERAFKEIISILDSLE